MSWVFLAVPVLILIGLLVFLYRRTAVVTRLGRRGRIGVGLGSLLLVGTALASVTAARGVPNPQAWRPVTAAAFTVAALVFYVFLCLIAVMIVNGFARLADRRLPASERPARRLTRIRRLTVAGLALAVAVTGYGVFEASYPKLTYHDFSSADLPAEFDGFKVALLTDVHVGPARSGEFLARAVEQVNTQNVDLVVLGGDMIDGTVEGLGEELRPLADFRSTYGTVAVTGNHEFYSGAGSWVAEWRREGLTVLANDALVLRRGTASIDVIGVNDRSGTPPLDEDLSAAMTRLQDRDHISRDDTGRFRLLVAHQPRQAMSQGNLAAKVGIDLQLSGHTHGGQMWPIRYLVRLQQPMVDGFAEVAGVTVFTSRGVGSWGPPVRVAAPPEIPIITLRRG